MCSMPPQSTTVWNFKRFVFNNCISFYVFSLFWLSSKYFLSAVLNFWTQQGVPSASYGWWGLCFKKVSWMCCPYNNNALQYWRQENIMRTAENSIVDIYGVTLGIVYRKHYGRKWGHLKITVVHPIIITAK